MDPVGDRSGSLLLREAVHVRKAWWCQGTTKSPATAQSTDADLADCPAIASQPRVDHHAAGQTRQVERTGHVDATVGNAIEGKVGI